MAATCTSSQFVTICIFTNDYVEMAVVEWSMHTHKRGGTMNHRARVALRKSYSSSLRKNQRRFFISLPYASHFRDQSRFGSLCLLCAVGAERSRATHPHPHPPPPHPARCTSPQSLTWVEIQLKASISMPETSLYCTVNEQTWMEPHGRRSHRYTEQDWFSLRQ